MLVFKGFHIVSWEIIYRVNSTKYSEEKEYIISALWNWGPTKLGTEPEKRLLGLSTEKQAKEKDKEALVTP